MTPTDGADHGVVSAVRAALSAVADPERAPAMQAYMKSEMPFLGVPKPGRTKALRPIIATWRPGDRWSCEATIRALYDEAGFREERYAALALLAGRGAKPWRDAGLVPLVEHLVTTGAWWDLVDEVAGHTVAPVHRAFPTEMTPVIRRWAAHDDLWLRRTAVLSQLGSGLGTDRTLLAEVVEANAARPEFWLRKAIGWALRDLAHRDPDWVRAYLAAHEDALSPLSRREAAKHLRTAPSPAAGSGRGRTVAGDPGPGDGSRY